MIEGLSIRRARDDDMERIADILADPPNTQMVAIAGNVPRAIAAMREMVLSGLAVRVETTVVAEVGGRVVGFMDARKNFTEPDVGPTEIARLLPRLWPAAGIGGLWRYARSRPAWSRVSFEPDADSYYIAELDVDAAWRNRGIGGALLAEADREARALGCPRITLSTGVQNPAQRLYERNGFTIVATKVDSEYERYGGDPGRVFMVKALD